MMPMTWLSQIFRSLARPLQWWVVIAPWEQGVRVRLGRTATELEAGPHWRIPFLDRVYVQSRRLRTTESGGQTLSTTDGKVLTLGWGMQFAVKSMLKLYQSVSNPEATLGVLVKSRVAEFVSTRKSDEVTPAGIEDAVNAALHEFENWGLAHLRCYVVSFAFAKTYRVINYEHTDGAGLQNIEHRETNGER